MRGLAGTALLWKGEGPCAGAGRIADWYNPGVDGVLCALEPTEAV